MSLTIDASVARRAARRLACAACVGALIAAGACADGVEETASAPADGAVSVSATAQASVNVTPASNASPSVQAEPAGVGSPTAQAAQATPATPASDLPGRLAVDRMEHDFGKVYTKEPLNTTFRLTNSGGQAIEIRRITTSCGCTVVKDGLEGSILQPGDAEVMDVAFSPRGTRKMTKSISILTTDPVQPMTRLRVSATLVETARMDPPRLQVGHLKAGQGWTGSFVIMGRDDNLEVLDVTAEDTQLEYTITEGGQARRAAGELRVIKTLDVSLPKNMPSGPVNIPVKVTVKAAPEEGMESREVVLDGQIIGNVRGDLANTPRFLRIQNKGAGEDFEARTRLYAESGRQFKVTSVTVGQTNCENVTAEAIPLRPSEGLGDGYWILVRGNTGGNRGAFQGTVIVETDIENEGPRTVVFNGIIRRSPRG